MLNRFHYFYTVAREGSFTRASKALRIQQPAISKMVKSLEDSLGVVLLERRKTGVGLTRAGTEVYQKCQLIFEQVEEIQAISEQERKECQGPLSIGITDSVSSYLLPRVMSGFLRFNPKVKPSVFAGSSNLIRTEIEDGRVELGISFTSPEAGDFEVSELLTVPFQLVGPCGLTPNEALKRGFVISREIDYPKSRPFPVLEMLRKNGVDVRVSISSNNLDSQKQMVLEGLGVALLPRFMVKNEILKGKLQCLHPRKEFRHPLRMVTRRRKVLSRPAREFLAAFQKAVGELV